MAEQSNVLNTNPSRYIIAGILVITLFFGGLTVWSVFFPFQGAVIASGVVMVSGERKTVQHYEGGIIDKILVKDGDKVKEGDVLIVLKSPHVSSNVDLLQGRLWAKMAEAARLKAEASLDSSITWPVEFETITNQQEIAKFKTAEQDLFVSKRADIQGKKDLYSSQILQLGNRIDGSKQELRSINEIIKNLQEDLNSKLPLVKEKYLGKTSILELQRVLSENRGRKGKLTQDIAQLYQMIEELKLRILDLETQYKDQALSKLKEADDEIFQTKEQIKPQVDAEERLKILAPVDGVVINMQVHSEGSGVILPARPILEIVPGNTSMIIKAHVRPQDIISLKVGQETKVQLAAFQRKATPPINGHITYVSPDLINQEGPHGMVSYYEIHAVVDENDLKAKDAYLSPGMPVSCYITTDKRTVISYLLGPLLKGFDKALRE
ncbi:MAG: HlyD family type I secretion periplasmic adaptor subunit [Desulfobulbus sp.]